MYQTTRLENGLTVASVEMPHMASVSLGIWVGVGGRHEPVDLCGVSHFIEHMLFKGTRKRSAKRISEDVEGVGGDINAYTSEENTCYFIKACHNRFHEMLDVLMDMFLHSKFEPVEIEKERSVIKEEVAMYMDQPQQYVQDLLNETIWPDHPLGRSVTGTDASVDKISREQILAFQKMHYVSENTIVAAAGHLTHLTLLQAISKYTKFFRKGNKAHFDPAPDLLRKPNIRLATRPIEQTQLALGIRVCSRHDEERYCLRLLNALIGENMSSRLFQVVREDHGLAYSIGSSNILFDDTGALTITAGLDTDKTHAALKLIMKELKRFTSELPSSREIRQARDYLIGQLELGLETTNNQMTWAGEQLLEYGKITDPELIKGRLFKIRPSEIRSFAQHYFRKEHLSLALVSPLKTTRGLEKLLEF